MTDCIDMGEEEEEVMPLLVRKKKKKPMSNLADALDVGESNQNQGSDTKTSTNTTTTTDPDPDPDPDHDYTYDFLLKRAFSLLASHSDQATDSGSVSRQKLPVILCHVVSSKKSIWTNVVPVCHALHRTTDHVVQFLLNELSTTGSLNEQQQLVIQGKFRANQIESVLKHYITEYIMCCNCKSGQTNLTRDAVTRLWFLDCHSCQARRSVPPLRSGFHATNRQDRLKAKQT